MAKIPQDPNWQKPVPVVNKLQNNLAFRQWRLSTLVGESSRDIGTAKTRPRLSGDFPLRAIHTGYNWTPSGNTAYCTSNKGSHPIPGFDCTCGLYCSYSSSIIYDPAKLGQRLYCFGAIRVQREGSVFCEYGIRAKRADVAGILFHPVDRTNTNVQNLMRRLDAEFIPHTFSAREFLKLFPDPDYGNLLKFDPVQRLAEFRYLHEGPGQWYDSNLDDEFARPVRREMLQAEEFVGHVEISVRPEYRPGGRLYRHPLLEVWPN